MRANDVAYLKVTAADGTVTAWYYLKVLHVDRHETTAGARASAARVGHSATAAPGFHAGTVKVRRFAGVPGVGALSPAPAPAPAAAVAPVAAAPAAAVPAGTP